MSGRSKSIVSAVLQARLDFRTTVSYRTGNKSALTCEDYQEKVVSMQRIRRPQILRDFVQNICWQASCYRNIKSVLRSTAE
ncbi:hypothetical protein HHX47_DHR4000452 [Lentinula edodes]|nr:hypothetical protein HHX47_DHR4000452 [Lentinula edodes]